MSFLYPQFLFGLLAIAIPVVIHLFNFQRPKRVNFTNVTFLRNVKEITSNKVKLKHILVLCCRILFITFLVLAFAQPFRKGKNASLMTGKPQVYFYLDNSYSMQNEVEGENALDLGIKSIVQLYEAYPYNTLFNILTNDFEGRDQYMINKERLGERLSEISFSNLYRDGNAVEKRISNTMEQSAEGNKHIFWLTDFQKSTIGDISKLPFDTSAQNYLLTLEGRNKANIFIDSIWTSSPMIRENENNTLFARFVNTGEKDVNGLLTKLIIDKVQTSTADVDVPALGSKVVSLNFNLTTGGSKKCQLTFEDFPVTFDNNFYFVMEVSPRLRILHLYGGGSDHLKFVFSNQKIFDLTSSQAGGFDYSLIPSANLIALENLENVSPSLAASLKDFLFNGGSVVIFPAADLQVSSYNAFLKSVSGASITKISPDTSQAKQQVILAPPDFNNPFFRDVFEKEDRNMDMPFAYPVMSWMNRGQRILSYKNQDAYLSSLSAGKGKLFLAAGALDRTLTNFPRHATFLPVLYKMAFQSGNKSQQMFYTFQEQDLKAPLDTIEEKAIFHVVGNGIDIIPDQRVNGRELVFSLPQSDFKPGFYDITSNGKIVKSIALDNGRKESVLDHYTKEELMKLVNGKKNVHIYEAGADKFIAEFKKENVGESIWKYCLILSLIFLLAEVLLLRFYR